MKGKELLKNIFASYNGGFNYKSPQAIAYSKDASLRIIALQRHFQKYSLETKLNAKYEIVASNWQCLKVHGIIPSSSVI